MREKVRGIEGIDWANWVPAGAIVAAALTYVSRAIESWRARKRELKGPLRLLAAEIERDQSVFDFFKEHPGSILGELAEGAGLQTRAWEENRARIAHLLESGEDFQRLADYFMNVTVFEKERLHEPEEEERKLQHQAGLLHHIDDLQEQGRTAQQIVNKVVGAKVKPQIEGPALDIHRSAWK